MEVKSWEEIRNSKQLKTYEIDTVIYHYPCSDDMRCPKIFPRKSSRQKD